MPAGNIAVIESANLSGEYDKPFNAAMVKQMLKENNLDTDFTAGELLRAWRTHN